jgi:hypothetical protein
MGQVNDSLTRPAVAETACPCGGDCILLAVTQAYGQEQSKRVESTRNLG